MLLNDDEIRWNEDGGKDLYNNIATQVSKLDGHISFSDVNIRHNQKLREDIQLLLPYYKKQLNNGAVDEEFKDDLLLICDELGYNIDEQSHNFNKLCRAVLYSAIEGCERLFDRFEGNVVATPPNLEKSFMLARKTSLPHQQNNCVVFRSNDSVSPQATFFYNSQAIDFIALLHCTAFFGEKMHFDSELPEDFQSLLTKWRNYVGGRKEIMDRS